ncbi:hypothetical protein LCGC14_2851430, partial [marine sediment metagenome]
AVVDPRFIGHQIDHATHSLDVPCTLNKDDQVLKTAPVDMRTADRRQTRQFNPQRTITKSMATGTKDVRVPRYNAQVKVLREAISLINRLTEELGVTLILDTNHLSGRIDI